MGIRVIVLYIIVAGLCGYAWKNWFVSLCGLLLLTPLSGHPDFNHSIANIQGLNVWNILLACIYFARLADHKRRRCAWDMPAHMSIFLLLWLVIILVGWVRMVLDRGSLPREPAFALTSLVSEGLINTLKWPIPGLLFFDACRTRFRVKTALTFLLAMFVLFSIQMAKSVPGRAILDAGNLRLRKNLVGDVNVSPNGGGKMMSGVPWAMLAMIPLIEKKRYKFLLVCACLISLYALGLTGSRSGMFASAATIMFLCLVRWRRYLLLLPLAAIIVFSVAPGAAARLMSGFGQTDLAGETATNAYEVTAGRNRIWPRVIEEIGRAPVFGFGRQAMLRTGLTQRLEGEVGAGEAVAHPHNAYLEVLLENGLIGFVIVIGLHGCLWLYAFRLFRDRGDPLYAVAGGVALALLTGHLIAYLGGQSFYPEEIDVGVWCAIGLMLRTYTMRAYWASAAGEMTVCSMPAHCRDHYSFANTI